MLAGTFTPEGNMSEGAEYKKNSKENKAAFIRQRRKRERVKRVQRDNTRQDGAPIQLVLVHAVLANGRRRHKGSVGEHGRAHLAEAPDQLGAGMAGPLRPRGCGENFIQNKQRRALRVNAERCSAAGPTNTPSSRIKSVTK